LLRRSSWLRCPDSLIGEGSSLGSSSPSTEGMLWGFSTSVPPADAEVFSSSSTRDGAEVGGHSTRLELVGSTLVMVIDTEGQSWSSAGACVASRLSDLRVGGAREPSSYCGRSSCGLYGVGDAGVRMISGSVVAVRKLTLKMPAVRRHTSMALTPSPNYCNELRANSTK
jgi:hypothetical protein